MANPTRTSSGSTPHCRATPPHRPATLGSLVLRRIVQTELMPAILPTGLVSIYRGRPLKVPLGEKSGTTLLVGEGKPCEAEEIMTATDSSRVQPAGQPTVVA